MTKIRVLTFIDYYLPGFKSGGPLRTIVNMVENFEDEIEFFIVTRDRDVGEDKPYTDVRLNAWNTVGKAKVFYASNSVFSIRWVHQILTETRYDVLYLNSFFSFMTTGKVLLVRRLGCNNKKPVIIAPRGEFSPGALQLKLMKKRLYIAVSKHAGMYSELIWQASSEYEKQDILSALSCQVTKNIVVAPNLLPLLSEADKERLCKQIEPRLPGCVRVIFLSRISPKKNLDFLLRQLAKVRQELHVSIYGPQEDSAYWMECASLIKSLPSNIEVECHGEVNPSEISQIFSQHDIFIFPTRGENFGHVIYESLLAGTPVMLSDQTPWEPDNDGALTVMSLDDSMQWVSEIESWARLDKKQLVEKRVATLKYVREYQKMDTAFKQNLLLFRDAVTCIN